MFSQISLELDLLLIEIDKLIDYAVNVRINETNPNLYIDFGGRLVAYSEIKLKIEKTQENINKHITEILKNTTDGNYLEKLDVLECENEVLQSKVNLLNAELKKYRKQQTQIKEIESLPECMKELSEAEMDDKINTAIADVDTELYIDEDEDV